MEEAIIWRKTRRKKRKKCALVICKRTDTVGIHLKPFQSLEQNSHSKLKFLRDHTGAQLCYRILSTRKQHIQLNEYSFFPKFINLAKKVIPQMS